MDDQSTATSPQETFAQLAATMLHGVLGEVKPLNSYEIILDDSSDGPQFNQANFSIKRPRGFLGKWLAGKTVATGMVSSNGQECDRSPHQNFPGAYHLLARVVTTRNPSMPIIAHSYTDEPATIPMSVSTPHTLYRELITEMRKDVAAYGLVL